MAGSAARIGSPAAPTLQCSSNGTRARSTRRRSAILPANSRALPDVFGKPGPTAMRTAPLTKDLLRRADVHGLAEMHGADADLAAQHRVLRQRNFFLRDHLAFAVGHGFDHGF